MPMRRKGDLKENHVGIVNSFGMVSVLVVAEAHGSCSLQAKKNEIFNIKMKST